MTNIIEVNQNLEYRANGLYILDEKSKKIININEVRGLGERLKLKVYYFFFYFLNLNSAKTGAQTLLSTEIEYIVGSRSSPELPYKKLKNEVGRLKKYSTNNMHKVNQAITNLNKYVDGFFHAMKCLGMEKTQLYQRILLCYQNPL